MPHPSTLTMRSKALVLGAAACACIVSGCSASAPSATPDRGSSSSPVGAAPVSPAVVTSAKPADDAGGTATSGKIEASCPAALPGFTLSQSSRGPSEYGVEDLDELFCLYDDTADGQILGYSVALYATESQAEAMNDPHADARKVYDLDTATPLEMGDGGWDTGDAAGCFVRYGREIVVAEIVTEKPDHAIHEHMLRWCAADPR